MAPSSDPNIDILPITDEMLDSLPGFWQSIPGIGLSADDDSPDGLRRLLRRNPGLSCMATVGGRLAGTLLCGHDGRRAMLYHVCVHPDHRGRGIGQAMVARALGRLKAEGIVKCQLVCFLDNPVGNGFWEHIGWSRREDLAVWQIQLPGSRQKEPSNDLRRA
jgi:ribosomal protein S18 acetylase RimI-like enzyme